MNMSNDKLTLRIRDAYDLKVPRDALLELPESILLCLFPNGANGALLNGPQRGPNGEYEAGSEGEEDEVYYVDFDGHCLEHVLAFFDKARADFYGTTRPPGSDGNGTFGQTMPNILFHKQAIIVLREELEYFPIPPAKEETEAEHPATNEDGTPNVALCKMKKLCGDELLSRRSIFTALQRNVNRENNLAEQHLIDMLCMSGFTREHEWGYRAVEPQRCCIISIALVLLKSGISHPPRTAEGESPDAPKPGLTVNAAQLATAQKLLLFWRKPARKCWWDASEVVINLAGPGAAAEKTKTVKIWSSFASYLRTALDASRGSH